jgi:hypothetical protein
MPMPASVQPPSPSPQYWIDRRWIHDHYARLVADYPNEWIAVHLGQVLAAGPDLGIVEDAARSVCTRADIVFQFIDDGSLIF